MDYSMPDQRREAESYRDCIRGCLFGGAVGDALGYPVEFLDTFDIREDYGPYGITQYAPDRSSGKALISDDTQMTLFTATGLLFGSTRHALRGILGLPSACIALAYRDWYMTQTTPFSDRPTEPCGGSAYISWLCDVPQLYSRRAPGNTCLSALQDSANIRRQDFITPAINHSKGCGGVMRVAPLALVRWDSMTLLLREAAQAAAITHGHPLGYLPASVLCYIINRVVFFEEYPIDLKKIVYEARDAVCRLFQDEPYTQELSNIIDYAVELSENNESDGENIRCLGAGWVAEEALAIAIYCSLRYRGSFSAGIEAAVNHDGDSDSTGAITGNILGALLGYDAIEEQWKTDLELADVILEVADDLCYGCPMREYGPDFRRDWDRKYLHAKWKE